MHERNKTNNILRLINRSEKTNSKPKSNQNTVNENLQNHKTQKKIYKNFSVELSQRSCVC